MVVLISAIAMVSCSTKTSTELTTAITTITDKSDSLQVYPSSKTFDQLVGKNIWKGQRFRFVDIGNTSMVTPHEFSIEPSTRSDTPKKIRVQQFNQLKTGVNDYVESQEFQTISGFNRSIIFEKLTSELELLHKTEADQKALFLYTDMLEFDRYSFYDPATFARLESDQPNLTKALLPLNQTDYSDITIYWIYRCNTYQENQRYRVIRDFLQKSFASYSITFIPRASTPTSLELTPNQLVSE